MNLYFAITAVYGAVFAAGWRVVALAIDDVPVGRTFRRDATELGSMLLGIASLPALLIPAVFPRRPSWLRMPRRPERRPRRAARHRKPSSVPGAMRIGAAVLPFVFAVTTVIWRRP